MDKPKSPSPYDLNATSTDRKIEQQPNPKNPDYSPYTLTKSGSLKTLRDSSRKR
jgi:hypothetical protein